MPRIEIRSTRNDERFQLASSNPETIGSWLAEIFDLIKPDQTAPAQVQFYPLWKADGQPDFTVDSRFMNDTYLIQSAGWHGVAELAEKLTQMVLREVEAGGAPSLPQQV